MIDARTPHDRKESPAPPRHRAPRRCGLPGFPAAAHAGQDPCRPDCLPPAVCLVPLSSSLASSRSSVALRFNLFCRSECEIERRALAQFRICPHSAAMFLHDALHGSQADAGTFKVLRAMQTLEDSEQFVHILHVEADTIV